VEYWTVGKVVFRLVFPHDLTYAIEMTMADGTQRVVKGFDREARADAWLAEQKRLAPKDEIWIRRPLLSWRS
jgi:hypothetical protein